VVDAGPGNYRGTSAIAADYRTQTVYTVVGSRAGTIGPRQRHIALTIYLWFLIVANTFITVWYIYWLVQWGRLADAWGVSLFDNWQAVFILLMVFAYAVDIVVPIALMKWKRWGFWYFSVLVGIAFVFNLVNGNVLGGLLNLVGWGILFGLLQLGGEYRAWRQLE
jgi:hypothetical protein